MTCAQVDDLCAEIALGTVCGPERGEALAHLASCPRCRSVVDDLAVVADGLLALAPADEPPPGFESRVLDRVAPPPQARPARAGRLRAAAMAAVVVAVAAAGGGLASRLGAGDDGPLEVRTALVVSASGRSTCRVAVVGREPAAMVLSIDGPAGMSVDYPMEAQPVEGPPVPLPVLHVRDGRATVTADLPVPADRLRSIRVFDDGGRLLYEAFPEPATSGP